MKDIIIDKEQSWQKNLRQMYFGCVEKGPFHHFTNICNSHKQCHILLMKQEICYRTGQDEWSIHPWLESCYYKNPIPYNLEALRVVFIKAWHVSQNLDITEVGERLFVFRFQSQLERAKVFLQQPWSFNKALLVLVDFNEVEIIDESLFETCPFWVQLHGVPAGLRMEKVRTYIIGKTYGWSYWSWYQEQGLSLGSFAQG